MPPKLKPDDLIDALLDARVAETMAKARGPYIALPIEESLKMKLKEFESAIKDLKTDNTRLNAKFFFGCIRLSVRPVDAVYLSLGHNSGS